MASDYDSIPLEWSGYPGTMNWAYLQGQIQRLLDCGADPLNIEIFAHEENPGVLTFKAMAMDVKKWVPVTDFPFRNYARMGPRIHPQDDIYDNIQIGREQNV